VVVAEINVFVEDETKVVSGVDSIERVVCVGKLLMESNNKTFSFRRVERVTRLAVIQEEICCKVFYR